ncbi:MAG: pyruvate synthase subunit PorB [Nitrososphaerota archaeon]|nr:pyruvate synthase subunit PorB [Nitrososphaerales archaeon]MDW8045332.1 pyruvate synthase subunit PorB [Nitrososphaerota archaeon]
MYTFYKTVRDIPKEEYLAPGHGLCQGCPEGTLVRWVTKVAGKDCIIVTPTGCLEVSTSIFPDTAWRVPWVHIAFENAGAVASGIEAALKSLKKKGVIPQDRKIHVIVIAGDGGTTDIGFQSLSGMLERGHDVVYICQDNEAYMNTGIQRSGSTPFGAWATTSPVGKVLKGKMQQKKDMLGIAAAHRIPYVASAAISPYWRDLFNKVKTAIDVEGPAYIHVLSPCPTGWRYDPSLTIEVGKLAVQTGMWVLYEIYKGKMTVNVRVPKRKRVEEYLKIQGRFAHLTEDMIEEIQKQVDEYVAEINKMVGEEVIGPVEG